jgi:hypothetical protein
MTSKLIRPASIAGFEAPRMIQSNQSNVNCGVLNWATGSIV